MANLTVGWVHSLACKLPAVWNKDWQVAKIPWQAVKERDTSTPSGHDSCCRWDTRYKKNPPVSEQKCHSLSNDFINNSKSKGPSTTAVWRGPEKDQTRILFMCFIWINWLLFLSHQSTDGNNDLGEGDADVNDFILFFNETNQMSRKR